MEDALVSTRCHGCGDPLAFREWSTGSDVCRQCRQSARGSRTTAPAGRAQPAEDDYESYVRMLDELPDELVDELVAALEAEAAREPVALPSPAVTAMQDVLREIAGPRSGRDIQWAAWGFAGGFALNVLVAKYAQMTSGGPLTEFLVPMLFGGVLAGAACGAIGWGVSRLRDR